MANLKGADATKLQVARLREILDDPIREIRPGHPLNHGNKAIKVDLTWRQIKRRRIKLQEQEAALPSTERQL